MEPAMTREEIAQKTSDYKEGFNDSLNRAARHFEAMDAEMKEWTPQQIASLIHAFRI